MKTIFIPINQGFAARFVLQTDIFMTLINNGVQLVLLVPKGGQHYFHKYLNYKNVKIESYEMEEYGKFRYQSKIETKLHTFRMFILNGRGDISTIKSKLKAYLKDNAANYKTPMGRLKKAIFLSFIYLGRYFKTVRKWILWIEHRFYTPNVHASLFEKYKPDLLLSTSLGIFDFDDYWMREAKKRGIPITSVILSWDNTSAKGMPGAIPDQVIAWTDAMVQELVKLNDIPKKKIKVGGPAHFDYYFREETYLSREELQKKLNLDPTKKIIFFGTSSPNISPWTADYARVVLEGLRSQKIQTPAQLLLRVHPIHYRVENGVLRFEKFLKELKDLKLEFPELILNEPELVSSDFNYAMPESEISLLATILKESGVIFTNFSTLNIEACLLDIPCINVAYFGPQKSLNSKARYSIEMEKDYSHIKRFLATGGTSIANSPDELLEQIDQYLKNPALHREQRAVLAAQELGPHRGVAGQTVGKLILDQLSLMASL